MRAAKHSLPLVAALAALAAACIDTGVTDPDPVEPMCEVDSDCDDGAGEICDEGVCWGDPPADRTFAAVLVPPESRGDLIPTEVPELAIESDGTVDGLVFAPRVTVSGRIVLAADSTHSIAAQIKVRRPSRIPGGPTYTRTVIAGDDAGDSEVAFEIALPRLAEGDAPYEITVVPDDGTLAEPGPLGVPAQLAPPTRFTFDGIDDMLDRDFVLGDQELMKRVAGRVVDAADRGLAGMNVFARGRWRLDSELERASSSATTDDEGFFAIWIPLGMEDDSYELVVRPPPGVVAPTLRKRDVLIPDPLELLEIDLEPLQMPSFPAGSRYAIPVRGQAAEGGIVPAVGAEVTATTFLLDPAMQEANGGVVAFYTATGVTDEAGNVELELIPGGQMNRPYLVTVQPLATSQNAALYAEAVVVGPPNPDAGGVSVLPEVKLGFRLSVSGVLRAADGTPIASAAISASASPIFKWSLDFALQDELDNFRFPTATTDAEGRFVIWLDENLLGAAAAYDLHFVPAAGAQAPRWSIHSIDIGARVQEGVVDLGEVYLPPASFARGDVLTVDGEAIAGAEVKVYEISTDTEACNSANVPDPNGECYPPALLRHVTSSSDQGQAVLVLPDP